MAGHAVHHKIAEMAGISPVISDEINRFMKDINPPEEFEVHNTERKIFVCGHLNISIRTLIGSEKLYNRGKNECIQREDLKWLLIKRKEYIICYYLYLAVDNIYENRDRIEAGGETIENCINSWVKNHGVTIPGTEAYLKSVSGFLSSNVEKIRYIIFLDRH